ncbi:uncharacterized protein A1O9_12261 [Exophiala aquamarina CBS 119918]|uniref:Uncharacterized protein n=1 Tax=Exophiala aquamarina CBS 119918 TaxID=1182545 RepID=A0A072NVJ0_9EURO|nr:uncharacterized protein A1O9_12261 [Exophiala aquamarina CBS 119918]KEF51626.1 hypothetical protein A1O9_12261 [Exophiala aquamarina CBS 119918]
MANIEVEWEVEGIISPQESVTKMLKVIEEKGKSDSGTFWCWDGKVCLPYPDMIERACMIGMELTC